MAAQLIECTKEEQWSVIRFLWSVCVCVCVKTGEIYISMTIQHGNNCTSHSKVHDGVQIFEG